MSDDAEYYMEQQEEELRSRLTCEQSLQDGNKKTLLCWSGKCRHELWEWEPLIKVLNVFSNLYHLRKIGSDYFLACNVPIEDYEEDCDYSENHSKSAAHGIKKKIIDDLEFDVVDNENEATHEVIVISKHDAALLKEEANRQNNLAKSLKDVMLAEMIVEIAEFVESDSRQNIFVFAREI